MTVYLLKKLKQNRQYLTKQQVKTIRGQILAGDLAGAEKGLNKLLKRASRMIEE